MATNFTAFIDAWTLETQKRITRVVQASIAEVIDRASVPVGKGGNMPVDTGFLRASGQVSYSGMPSGPGRGEPDGTYDQDRDAIIVQLASLPIGATVYFGWVANYAGVQENKRAFLRLSAQQWPDIVAQKIAQAKAR